MSFLGAVEEARQQRAYRDNMTENLDGAVTETTCGICLEEPKDPMNLPCGHSFCDGCINEWRPRCGAEEEMRRKCPICRARIPPSREMVTALLSWRARKQRLEDNEISSEEYHRVCLLLEEAETFVGADWDGVTVLEDSRKPPLVMPDHITMAIITGDIKPALAWINANPAEDRANAISSTKLLSVPALAVASASIRPESMTLLLQQGANVDTRDIRGGTAISMLFSSRSLESGFANERIRLLLSWGASFISDVGRCRSSKEHCIYIARKYDAHELAILLESELGGRRCEIINLSSRPELNGKTCVADKYLPDSNQYRVTLETKSKEVLVLDPENLKRRDRTPQDCGYYIEFKNGRTIRHDFDSSEDCRAFVAALNRDDTQPAVTEEAEARAEQAAAELLAELGIDDSPNNVPTGGDQAKKSKKRKKKGGKKKK